MLNQNHITMKKLFTYLLAAITLIIAGCSESFDDSKIWDKINDHENRILALEELCRQLNTNIDALQTIVEALEKNDYVTNVSPVREDGEIIGYTITFAYSDTITIYNGKDGKDGQNGADGKDGQDGYTPQIGVMKDTDGSYYWTVDGEWLLDGKGNKVKAVGQDGKDGQDGTNGSDGKDGVDGEDGKDGVDGEDGQDGTDGQDGITPRLKIENDYWYVSYDEGATWIELGKATGDDGADGADGSDGADGADGDSIFTSVTQDDEHVYFNLADGSMITLPKHDKENIQFEDFNVKRICVALWDANGDFELSYNEAKEITSIGTHFASADCYFFDELQYFTGIEEIEEKAFENSSLMKVVIPSGVRTIGKEAFLNCGNLKRVDFSLCANLNIVGTSAFQNTVIKEVYIRNSVRQIQDKAFYQCAALETLTFEREAMVEYIGESAFEGTNVNSLSIPASVITIGPKAFIGTPIKSLVFEEGAKLEIIKGEPSEGEVSGYKYDYKGAFAKCQLLEEIKFPNSILTLEAGAFEECTSLKKVTFEEDAQITKLIGFLYLHNSCDGCGGHGVFTNCTSLESIILPKSLTTIGTGTFSGCKNLTNIEFEFGSSLTRINGDKCRHPGSGKTCGVFDGCSTLSVIKLGGSTPPSCSSYSFYGITKSNIKLKVPAGSLSSYQSSSSWESFKLEEYYE